MTSIRERCGLVAEHLEPAERFGDEVLLVVDRDEDGQGRLLAVGSHSGRLLRVGVSVHAKRGAKTDWPSCRRSTGVVQFRVDSSPPCSRS